MIREIDFGRESLYPEPPLVIAPGSFQGTEEELAQVILKQVENHPETFDMSAWGENSECMYYSKIATHRENKEEITTHIARKDGTACGTTLCIAGYAQLFVDGHIDHTVENRAAELLGLSRTNLFYESNDEARHHLREIADGTYVLQDCSCELCR